MFDKIITTPLGYLLGFIYDFVGNYGVSLIIFTILIKLVLLPLALKQQKSTTKMQQIQPMVLKIQEKYKNDQQKMSEETMKLYKEYGVNPAGGCLPLLIQMPVLFGLYAVIYQPLTYMRHMTNKEILGAIGMTDFSKLENLTGSWNKLINSAENVEIIAPFLEKAGIVVENIAKSGRQLQILIAENIDKVAINFDFFGMNLAQTPSIKEISPIWIIPILAAVTTYLTSKVSTAMAKKDNKKEEKEEPVKKERVLSPDQKTKTNTNSAESMTKSMSITMPLITLWFTFTMPATMGFYWTISNILAILQTVALNGYYKRKLAPEIEAQTQEIIHKKELKDAKYKNKKKKRG